MNYTGTNQVFDKWLENLGKGVNLATDTFKCMLVSNSYVPNFSTHAVLADVTNEVSGNGYARQSLGNVSFGEASGTAKFTADNLVFAATGGPIVARRFVIYDDSVASPVKPLVCSGLINSADADVTITDGNTLTIQVPGAGLFSISR